MFGSKARKPLQIVRLGVLPMECTDWGRWGVPSKALQEMGKGSTEPWLPGGGLQEQPSNHLTVLRRQRPGAEREGKGKVHLSGNHREDERK